MITLLRPLALVAFIALAPALLARTHPSFFFSPPEVTGMRERSESTAWLRACRASVLSRADTLLATPTSPYHPVGDALTEKNAIRYSGRLAQARIGTLALAGYLTGDERYFRKSVAILLAIVRQYAPEDRTVWPNHLQYSDATQALALGYDLLHPYLSDAERAEVRAEIRQYGHLLYSDDSTWGADAVGVSSCNHNAVHFGALGLAALALGDEPAWLARATERVSAYFASFADATGYVTEGHHYLGYGQLGSVPFALALKRAGGRDLFREHPVLEKINDQLVWLLLPIDGAIRTLNDNLPSPPGVTTLFHSLAHGHAVQLWAWLEANKTNLARDGLYGELPDGFGDFVLFVSGTQPLEPVSPGTAGWPLGKHYASGRVMLRSEWDNPDAAHVVFNSGHDFHQGHNQQDENSVSFAALGEDFLTDPGYWPDGSDCHTTLRINGVEQRLGSFGRVLKYREDEFGALVRGQSQEAYPIVPGFVGLAERKLYFVRGPDPYLVWRDDVGIEVGNQLEVVTRFVTHQDNRITPHGDAAIIEGANGRGRCLVVVYSEEQPLSVREDKLEGQSYIANLQTKVVYTEHLRRLSAKVDKKHHRSRLLTLMLPFREEAELPRIDVRYDRETDTFNCRLSFSEGRVDTLVFSATDANCRRNIAE